MEPDEIRVGDVIWNTDTGGIGRAPSVVGTKMALLDPAGEETAVCFAPSVWEKLRDQARRIL